MGKKINSSHCLAVILRLGRLFLSVSIWQY